MGALRTLTVFFLAAFCGAGYAGSPADFHPLSAVDPPVGTYVVYCIDDTELASIANELVAVYHGRIEPYAQPGVCAFAITMLPSRARLMSLDPRVRAVIEQPKRLDHAAHKREAKNVSLTQALQPHVLGTETWGPRGFTYDGAGNITAFGSDTYAYDTAGRLLIATPEGSSNRQTYGYDGFGNRVSAARDPNAAGCGGVCETSPQIQPSTNHLSDSGVVYDAAGDLRALGNGNSFTYDGVSMATRAQVGGADLRYVYTADDERIAVYANAAWTWTVRDLGGRPIREFTSANQVSGGTTLWGVALRAWSRDTIWRGSLLLASVAKTSPSDPTVVIQHFHLDHLGTPRLITDAAGVKTSLHNYYPFGAELAGAAEAVEATTKFTGHTRDLGRGTGALLDYMHARYYDGMAGRFLSVDPVLDIKGALRKPQAWNRYSYVMNNPVRYTDPDGRECGGCLAFERDNQDLLHGRISVEEFNARNNARGVGALIGAATWAGWLGVRAVVSWLGVGAVSSTTSGGSILLGETMRRVQPIADEMNAGTFNQAWTGDKAQMMARNMTWLQGKMESGARIFDLGKDALKQAPSDFYAAETKLLQSSGYTQKFVKYVMVNGEAQKLFEWVKKAQ